MAKTFEGDYSACLSMALRIIYKQIRAGKTLFQVTARRQGNVLIRLANVDRNEGMQIKFAFAKDEYEAATKVIIALNNSSERAYYTEACCEVEAA